MIERAMQNLLENAIRYTPHGGKVTVAVEQRNSKIRTRVEDTGVGIPEKDLPLIFNRFYRARMRETSSGGAGLGLAITKKILEAHGESIEVESRVNEGTKFVFDLPVANV
jgi:two-component system sensor histidine kinase ResE